MTFLSVQARVGFRFSMESQPWLMFPTGTNDESVFHRFLPEHETVSAVPLPLSKIGVEPPVKPHTSDVLGNASITSYEEFSRLREIFFGRKPGAH